MWTDPFICQWWPDSPSFLFHWNFHIFLWFHCLFYQLIVHSTEPNTSLLIFVFPLAKTLSPLLCIISMCNPLRLGESSPKSALSFNAQPASYWCFVRCEEQMLIWKKCKETRSVAFSHVKAVFFFKSDNSLNLISVQAALLAGVTLH